MVTVRQQFPLLVDCALTVGPGFELGAYADWELTEVAESDAWDAVLSELAETALGFGPDRTMFELFPGLEGWADVRPTDLESIEQTGVLSVRANNCLLRSGILTWGNVGKLDCDMLLRLRNFGRKSALEILTACARLAALRPLARAAMAPRSTSNSGEDSRSNIGVLQELLAFRSLLRRPIQDPVLPAGASWQARTATSSGGPSASGVLVEEIASILEWASAERAAATVGQVFAIATEMAPFPPEVAAAWSHLFRTDATVLGGSNGALLDLDSLLDQLLSSFAERDRMVLEARVFTLNPPTQEEVGTSIGRTRQRIDQMQKKAERRLGDLLNLPRFRVLSWRAADLAVSFGRMAPVNHPVTESILERALRGASTRARPAITALLLRQAGHYKEKNGWFVRDGSLPFRSGLAAFCDEVGLIPVETAHKWLHENDVNPSFHDEWLSGPGGFRRFGDTLSPWSGTVVDKCVTVLAAQGTPASAETLVGIVGEGHSVRGSQARFFEDPRLMRVNRTDWALTAWSLEEYTGIAEEIAQQIEKAGGRARLSNVVTELVKAFQVSEGSVKSYAYAPMFVLENGWIRLRRSGERYEVRGTIADCKGVYRLSNSRISVSVPVDAQVARGSGRGLPGPVGAALGVLPGEVLTFRAGSCQLKVTWPISSFLGASLGSIRELADEVGATEGDQLRLEFDIANLTVSGTRVRDSTDVRLDATTTLRSLTGVDDLSQPMAAIGEAIGVASQRAVSSLRARGDGRVADLLTRGAATDDGGLSVALEELARHLLEPGVNN